MNFILHKILSTQNLDVWSRLRKEFFEPPYTEIYLLINKFYQRYDKLPTFEELEIITRDEKSANYVGALKELQVPEDLDIEILLQALINEFAQKEVLNKLSTYLDELNYKDVGEIVEDLATIAIDVEEKTEISEQIVMMNDFITIDTDLFASRVPLGLNNDFDRHSMGLALSEYIMLGGFRGSGKSLVCANIVCNQYMQGNTALYFSIEMSGRELYNRYMAILTGIPEKSIKSGNLSTAQKIEIAKVRAHMTQDGAEDLLKEFEKTKDLTAFEIELMRRPLSNKSRIITIDNSNLTIPNIDATLNTFKTKFEDNLKVVVVDYINQITCADPYNWASQIELSKKLKALAKKYEVVMVSPFQTSEEGKVRFSKGILDSPDWAFNLSPVIGENEYGVVEFECKKSRGDEKFNFSSEIHWPTLKISPHKNLYTDKKIVEKVEKTKKEPAAPPVSQDDLSL